MATRVSGHLPPTSGTIFGDVRQPRAWGELSKVIRMHGHSGRGRAPVIPYRECPILPSPSKILLSIATPTLRIEKSCASVRRLRPKSHPLVIRLKHAIPIAFCNRFLSYISFGLLLSFLIYSFSFVLLKTMLRRDHSLASATRLRTHRILTILEFIRLKGITRCPCDCA